MNKAHAQRPTTRAQVIEFPYAEKRTKLEANIEARLQELANFAEGFGDAGFNFLRAEKTSVREAIEELIVKETALHWIVGVAKRSAGRVRENLWVDIDRALTDLERTAESLMRDGEKWAQSDP